MALQLRFLFVNLLLSVVALSTSACAGNINPAPTAIAKPTMTRAPFATNTPGPTTTPELNYEKDIVINYEVAVDESLADLPANLEGYRLNYGWEARGYLRDQEHAEWGDFDSEEFTGFPHTITQLYLASTVSDSEYAGFWITLIDADNNLIGYAEGMEDLGSMEEGEYDVKIVLKEH